MRTVPRTVASLPLPPRDVPIKWIIGRSESRDRCVLDSGKQEGAIGDEGGDVEDDEDDAEENDGVYEEGSEELGEDGNESECKWSFGSCSVVEVDGTDADETCSTYPSGYVTRSMCRCNSMRRVASWKSSASKNSRL